MQDAWVSQIKESKVTAGMRNIGWVTFLRKYPSETSYKTFFEYVEKYNINKTRVGVIARRCPDFFMSLSAEELKKYGIKGKNLVTIFYDFHQFAGFKHVVPSDFHLEMMEHQLVLDLMRGKPTSISVREKLDFVKELV